MDAVRKVWASVFSDRAWEARERFGIDHATALPAVLIQEGVAAEAAGVLLAGDPEDPADRDAVRVAAKRGLGLRVVQGGPLPEQVRVRPATGETIVLSRSEDRIALAFDERGGLRERPVAAGAPVLDKATVLELARLGLEIRRVFGGVPQDVEWVVEGGRVWIVQARPYPVQGGGR